MLDNSQFQDAQFNPKMDGSNKFLEKEKKKTYYKKFQSTKEVFKEVGENIQVTLSCSDQPKTAFQQQ